MKIKCLRIASVAKEDEDRPTKNEIEFVKFMDKNDDGVNFSSLDLRLLKNTALFTNNKLFFFVMSFSHNRKLKREEFVSYMTRGFTQPQANIAAFADALLCTERYIHFYSILRIQWLTGKLKLWRYGKV